MNNTLAPLRILRKIGVLTIAAIALSSGATVAAQDNTPLRILVGFTPGGAADAWVRIITEPLSKVLGRSVIVDNKPGASGNIAAQMVVNAKPDDNVLFMTGAPQHGSGAAATPSLPFDPERDFTLVATLAETANVITVAADSPYADLKALVDDALARPGKITFGSPGAGTSPHLVFELLKLKTGVNITHAPYHGPSQAMTDLMGGHIDFVIVPYPGVSAQIKAGKLRGLAVLGDKRLQSLESVPTAEEAGFKDVKIRVWGGLVGPAGMKTEDVQRLNSAINGVLRLPQTRERLLAMGSTPFITSPEEFQRIVHDDLTNWREIVRAADIKLTAN